MNQNEFDPFKDLSDKEKTQATYIFQDLRVFHDKFMSIYSSAVLFSVLTGLAKKQDKEYSKLSVSLIQETNQILLNLIEIVNNLDNEESVIKDIDQLEIDLAELTTKLKYIQYDLEMDMKS